ncbi:hypothetical protein LJB42_004769 [Komagataella kurtzmanii]|nr:hypothetical protein LJB42_004769 [Komagataella kurtzmanii]
MSGQQGSKLPMIVDVSIDEQGKQVYQVHSTKKRVRDDMPVSNFKSSKVKTESSVPLAASESGSSSSSASNVKEEEQDLKIPGSVEDTDVNPIWPADVELAFREALTIIPKKGLNKIKISGKCSGRNELISDYIFSKTGQVRTRKQVSSHIQVVKNMNKDHELIKLILEGPEDSNLVEPFDSVFTKIVLAKTTGGKENNSPENLSDSENDNINITPPATALRTRASVPHLQLNDATMSGHQDTPIRATSARLPTPSSDNRDSVSLDRPLYVQAEIQNFQFCLENTVMGMRFHLSNLQEPGFMYPPLRLKENANIKSRFPYLDSFASTLNTRGVPILHGMTKIGNINYEQISSMDAFRSNSYNTLQLDNLSVENASWSVVTAVYSFGKEKALFVDPVEVKSDPSFGETRMYTLKVDFANRFWNAYTKGIWDLYLNPNIDNAVIARKEKYSIKGTTIKQVLVSGNLSPRSITRFEEINSSLVRCILLWEFHKAEHPEPNTTTIRRLHLTNDDAMYVMNQPPFELTPQSSSKISSEAGLELPFQNLQRAPSVPYLDDSAHQMPVQQIPLTSGVGVPLAGPAPFLDDMLVGNEESAHVNQFQGEAIDGDPKVIMSTSNIPLN